MFCVAVAPFYISYTPNPVVGQESLPFTAACTVSTLEQVEFSVVPALPAGLELNSAGNLQGRTRLPFLQ